MQLNFNNFQKIGTSFNYNFSIDNDAISHYNICGTKI